jgi:hypothetical protein
VTGPSRQTYAPIAGRKAVAVSNILAASASAALAHGTDRMVDGRRLGGSAACVVVKRLKREDLHPKAIGDRADLPR